MYKGAVIAVRQPGWEIAGQVVFLTSDDAWVKVLGRNEVLVLTGWAPAYNRGEITVLLPKTEGVLFEKTIVETSYVMGPIYWWQRWGAKCRRAKYRPYRGKNVTRNRAGQYGRLQMYERRQLITGHCCVDGTLLVIAGQGSRDSYYIEAYNRLKTKYPGIWERWVK
jgi:hypothetical protein